MKKIIAVCFVLALLYSQNTTLSQVSKVNPMIFSSGYSFTESTTSKAELIVGQSIVGFAESQNSGVEAGFFFRQKKETGVIEEISDGHSLIILQNRPNPAGDFTVIPYSTDLYGRVTLEIFSILGQGVRSVQLGEKTPGNHLVRIDCSGIVQGVYFYKITINDVSKIKVMVKL